MQFLNGNIGGINALKSSNEFNGQIKSEESHRETRRDDRRPGGGEHYIYNRCADGP